MSDDEDFQPRSRGRRFDDDEDEAPSYNSRRNEDDEEEEERKREEERRRKEEEEAEKRRKEQAAKSNSNKNAAGAKKGKRKGLGGLGPEKKKLLKQLIMQKAADEMKEQMAKKKEEKDNHLKALIGVFQIDGLDQGKLDIKVREYYKRLCKLEEDKYDLESKIRSQEFEINELTIKVNDVKGKFVKPVLKKVSKTESKLAKFEKKESKSASFRDQLKSTGQNKFALEEKDEEQKKPDWREHLKEKTEGEDGEGEAKEDGEAPAAGDNEETVELEIES